MANTPEGPVDLYRNTPVRYLGYANEVGEAFRSIIGARWVTVTYGIATAYVIADTADKTKKMHDVEGATKKTFFVAGDTLMWQMLASVVMPGVTINRLCAVSNFLLQKLPSATKKWSVTTIGLTAIPFIIKPIDDLVDKILDGSLRKYAP